MRSYQQFLAELKRRHVFKVAAIYGAAAFILLQLADLLGQGLRLGDTFLPFITAVVLLGFPLAVILAWAFEVTPDGVRRTGEASAREIAAIVAQPASKRWPAGLLALAGVAALIAGAWWVGRQSAPMPAGDSAGGAVNGAKSATDVSLTLTDLVDDERPSIAVLPFADMSPEGDQEYFGDGMTEEILNTLARVRELRVSGRTSAFAYKGQEKDLRQIGDELGVSYLVEGSVRKAENRLRITAQLIDAADGSHLWSDQYDRAMDDVFAIQTEIAQAIAEELRVPLGLDASEDLVTPTADLAAYDLYLAARTKMRERGPSLLEAVELLEAAIDRDSTWAPAWAALAEVSEIRLWYETARPPNMTRREFNSIGSAEAERAARRALELDPQNSSALVALGSVQRNRGEWKASEATYLTALSLDPDDAEAHHQYGDLLCNVGRIAEGVRFLDQAAALDPAPVRLTTLAFGLLLDGRLSEGVELYELAVSRDNTDAGRHRWLGQLARYYLRASRWEEAVETLTKANRSDPEAETIIGSRAQIEAFVSGLALGDLSRIPAETVDDMRPFHWLMVGEPDSAVAQRISRSEEFPFGRVIEFWYPEMDPLRSDARIQTYLEERGLAGIELHRTPVAERTRPMILQLVGQ
ncbi:MAG: tetratricopeptide repeat protein [Gemmatimonadota bacterium]